MSLGDALVDMRYDAAGLHRAGGDHQDLAAGIDPIVAQIGHLSLEAGVLGLLPAATAFVAALDSTFGDP